MSTGEKELWTVDEVHFQQHGSRCRMWVPLETRDPVLLHHPTRKSVGYFGAVRLRDGKFVYHRETERFNGETFHVFLKRLRHRNLKLDFRVLPKPLIRDLVNSWTAFETTQEV